MKKQINVNVNVTQKDIDRSKELINGGMCTTCPIYFAISRIKKLKGYFVGTQRLYLHDDIMGGISLPEIARVFSYKTLRKDWHGLKPFKFSVEI